MDLRLVFIDLKKAFDIVGRNALWKEQFEIWVSWEFRLCS